MNGPDPLAEARRLAVVSIAVGAGLAGVKIAAGVAGSTFALVADGMESLLDVAYGVAAWSGYRLASRPPDDEHRFGHGKVEALMALGTALLLQLGAVWIAVQSIREIRTPHNAPAWWTLLVLLAVIVLKELLARRVQRATPPGGSVAVEADAWHHRSDALTSLAAFLGIAVALVGGAGYEAADDWAALVCCGIIAWSGWRLLLPAVGELLDRSPVAGVEQAVRRAAAAVPGVSGVEKCRLRRSGQVLFIDIHVEVPGDLSVREGHALAHAVKRALGDAGLGAVDADVHIEPAP